ncbi:MAG: helix-turn-helix domain-containing protein [Actinomycetaceae bacterium]|nr:helix-turn-helix domain-containing protein [Actinomycetaceae bacterium]
MSLTYKKPSHYAQTQRTGTIHETEKRGYFSVAQAAEHLGVSRKTVYDALYQGRLPYVKFGRLNRIPADALTPEALGSSN